MGGDIAAESQSNIQNTHLTIDKGEVTEYTFHVVRDGAVWLAHRAHNPKVARFKSRSRTHFEKVA